MRLQSIATEAKNCRKAFKGFEHRGFTLHCHHEILGEPLTEPAENRIAYILRKKPERERALRLRLFRPITKSQLKSCNGYTERNEAYAEYNEACVEWHKVRADGHKVRAEFVAHAEWDKAAAKRNEAEAKRNEANAECLKADAKLSKEVHDKFCIKDCPWNGKTIFPASTGGGK